MGNFFKIFFASLLALIVFTFVIFFMIIRLVGGMTSKDKLQVEQRSVLVLDLGQHYKEQLQEDPLSVISSDNEKDIPGLYDVIRLLQHARYDKNIEGILIQANPSPNGFAASHELREALLEFKQNGKFVIAHGDAITQRTYAVANAADKVYVSPQGFLQWVGFSVDYAFIKGTLDKLDIDPQIFYAGKFKSATEPLRAEQMTPENKLQTTVWLNDLYTDFLVKTSASRKIDTATLRNLAIQGTIRNPSDAYKHKLIDGVKYDDEVKDEIKKRLVIDKYEKIPFISINAYMKAVRYVKSQGEKIALIYAEGDIVDGKADQGVIGSDRYRTLVRKARLDRSVKAIVFRINSGGGSSLASENIWRELALAKKEKPVIVSFGDVAASGGYYIGCAADSIFALPVTITGSIGVFGIIPNMEGFFKNKLGVTFDGVKTAPYADALTVTRPMNEKEKQMIQQEVDEIYSIFKQRVAEGRKKDTVFVDSIAQGRVWTGQRAKEIGLIDRFGGLQAAVRSAAAMAKLSDYQVIEFPEPQNFFEKLFGQASPMNRGEQLKQEIGEDNYKLYQQLKKIKEMTNTVQARLPFEYFIH